MSRSSGFDLSIGPSQPPSTFLFVENATGQRKGRSKQSRAHVARVNRHRQKLKTQQVGCPPTGVVLEAAQVLSNNDGHALTINARGVGMPSSVPQTIQPLFGGIAINSFPKECSAEAAELAQFTFERVMDTWLSPQHKPAWIASFFQHPIVYHCLSFSCGVMQDYMTSRQIRPQRLFHRGKTISLVNQALSHLDHADIEPVMLAISSLWRMNTDATIDRKEVLILFKPHVRNLSWVNLFGRLAGDTLHGQALAELVNRRGGLDGFTTLPSLHESLALADVIDSSSNGSSPRFPSIWNAEHYLQALDPAMQLLAGDTEGSAFTWNVPDGLPENLCATLQRLAAVDKMLDDFSRRTVSRSDDYCISELSSAVQHELLSIQPWSQLEPTERAGSSEAMYELCRLASIIYATAVIFPVSASDPWLEKLLRQLRHLLETINVFEQGPERAPLLVWAIFVASMAAFWTKHRIFFTNLLRKTLHEFGLTSWDQVNMLLNDFLWRDSACQHGSTTLWKFLNLNEEVVILVN